MPRTVKVSAGDIVDQRGDLLDRLGESRFASLIVATMVIALKGQRGHKTAEQIPDALRAHVHAAELYRVTEDITILIEHAASLLDETDRWDEDLLPSPAGFVRFEKPLRLVDVHGKEMLIHVMTWGPAMRYVKNGVDIETLTIVSMWNDVSAEQDAYSYEIMQTHPFGYPRLCGRWSFVGLEALQPGMRVGPAAIRPEEVGLVHEAGAQAFTNAHRYMVALFMLMSQTVVEKTTERPNVHARRRARQRKLTISDVSIISLRRYRSRSSPDDCPTRQVNWTHRWIVRGHWRWTRVGPGRQERRRVWVTGYQKGPQDKELIIKSKVYDVKDS